MSPDPSASDALLGEIVAFTALPAVWVGQPVGQIARALVDALDRTMLPEGVAVLMRAEDGIVEARAGASAHVDAEVEAWREGKPPLGRAHVVGVGPMGARGAVFVGAGELPPERAHLMRLAANLADTALREAALHHQAATSRAQLLKLEKLSALGQLVSGVAHELRTPLTYANNSLHLARRRIDRAPLSPEDRASLQADLAEVLEAHERIEATVATLRRLSSPVAPRREAFPFSDAVGEAARLFALTHVGHASLARSLEARSEVIADRVQLHQVVLNLLQNAAEAVQAGGRVAISTEDAGERARLVVEDDGPGIPPEVRGRIFEPFFTTKPGGTGLGLSIVRRILESHGATMTVGASASGGARFEVSFPVAAPARHTLSVTSSSAR